MDADERTTLATVADYQFGAGAGAALFAPGEYTVERTSSGRPRQIWVGDGVTAETSADRVVSYGSDGRFRLGVGGGRRLLDALSAPAGRVVVGDESKPFVRDGENVFAKFVREAAPEIRPYDEVCVVHERGDLLAVGRAELAAGEMLDFDTGMAVKVREGAGEPERGGGT